MRLLFATVFCLAAASLPRITAEQLWLEYQENEVAADLRYKGKTLVVSGIVSRVERNPSDVSRVDVFLNDDDSPAGWVICLMRKGAAEAPIARLRRGSSATLRCTGAGRSMSVDLRDCVLLSS